MLLPLWYSKYSFEGSIANVYFTLQILKIYVLIITFFCINQNFVDISSAAPLMSNKQRSPPFKKEGKLESFKSKLTEPKHTVKHKHIIPHTKQVIFLKFAAFTIK